MLIAFLFFVMSLLILFPLLSSSKLPMISIVVLKAILVVILTHCQFFVSSINANLLQILLFPSPRWKDTNLFSPMLYRVKVAYTFAQLKTKWAIALKMFK